MSHNTSDTGFSLLEVMVATMISGIALVGVMGMMEISSRYVQQGGVSTRALALVQARLEAKRSVRWEALLEDDLDHDGVAETSMKDDGQAGDLVAGDGIYTAVQEQANVTLVWTVEAGRTAPLKSIGMVAIRATATYAGSRGLKEVHVATLRANPAFVGER